jgi:site-specific DNA-methyltransferase (adenine-specific)
MGVMEQYINKIINDDCLNVLKQLPDKCIDLVLTDPPYRDEAENQPTIDMRKNGMVKSFGDRPSKEMFDEIFRVSKKQIIFGANNFELPPYKGFIVWNKGIAFDFTMSMCELAYISESCGTIAKIFDVRASGQNNRIHPTQKPVELFAKILNYYSKENDLVLDCFSGSGTTAIACHNLKRRFICIEKDFDYWKASCKRLEDHQRQGSLF